ncbi:class E sortase [Streptomyces diastatochromogenes]|uniref:Class E sortase n=2 Tax=Streptomyces diastatochromogenes TaxID=42236 RepID=A0A233SGA6_STRDA|nr:class E sortase [Streptomyces diastatochromogenes]MCZ0989007.1 class E sortase [Streptomyces diastatochromogenes]OXY94677.1 class E sortase [Streptomyces diastatochromogenes]
MRMRVVRHRDRRRRARWRRGLWGGGEVLVTVGVVLMLLVVHQLWWTNREARQGAERKVAALEKEWGSSGSSAPGSEPPDPEPSPSAASKAPGRARQRSYTPVLVSGTPRRSQAYAVLTIPRLHLRVPVAEGVSKPDVLNKGYVGHYPGTQQPGQAGNFALAGHRNTHGEPFRYLPRLRPEDTVQVETRTATYTYAVDKILPQTSSRDSGVVRPVPRSLVRPAYGYDEPGYYITLTTCTPEFTSRYRMVVWGKLVSMRPRG